MSDEQISKLTEALSSMTDIVGTLIDEAKVEHLSHLQKDNLQQRVSGARGLLSEVRASKLDDPSLS